MKPMIPIRCVKAPNYITIQYLIKFFDLILICVKALNYITILYRIKCFDLIYHGSACGVAKDCCHHFV